MTFIFGLDSTRSQDEMTSKNCARVLGRATSRKSCDYAAPVWDRLKPPVYERRSGVPRHFLAPAEAIAENGVRPDDFLTIFRTA